jgi:RHS repeat-associated protein
MSEKIQEHYKEDCAAQLNPRRLKGLRMITGIFGSRGRLASLILLLAFVFGVAVLQPHSAMAQSTTTGAWCGSLPPVGSGNGACSGSYGAACEQQFAAWAWSDATNSHPQMTGRWDYVICAWTRGPLGGPVSSGVTFTCPSSTTITYILSPDGVCIDSKEATTNSTKNDKCDTSNNEATQNPETEHPIDILTGAKLFRVVDFQTADDSLRLERNYNTRSYIRSNMLPSMPPLGVGSNWRFFFQHEIWFYTNSADYVELYPSDGSGSYYFARNGSGGMDTQIQMYGIRQQQDYRIEFVGTWPSNHNDLLTYSSQWRMYDAQDRVWLFQTFLDPDSGKYRVGRPVSVTFRGGLQWTFTYGTNSELTSIQDSYGKTITFTWVMRDMTVVGGTGVYPAGIETASLPDGTTLKYLYDSGAPLGLMPAGVPLNHPYTAGTSLSVGYVSSQRLIGIEHRDASNNLLDSTSYLFEDTLWPYYITGIKDTNGTRRWTVSYDGNGRAIESKGPSDVDKSTVAYGAMGYPSPSFTRTVTNALGKDTVYTYHYDTYDVNLDSVNGTASTNCPSSTSSLTYSNYYIDTKTDEEGRVTKYTRNSIGQPTQIIDGYGTASARTTSITWHSTLHVPTQVVQPGLTTDYTWNSSGQLTQVTQTDTTSTSVPYSTNGQTRTWAYTYDSYGRPLTVDGPLSGSGDTVTYTYDTNGYVASITNELSQTLTVSAVNGRGKPTTVVDAGGITRNLAYDSEGRLTSIAVDPSGLNAVTSFDYNVVGDITKITRPNGAYLQYTYDDARRVTKVEDNTGGYIEYDVDAMKNPTARRIKTAGGTTKLSQTATFDELGRLLTFVGNSSQTWTHAYDKTDNRVSVTDPRSNVFGWAFDSVNRLVGATDEDSGTVTLTRNGQDKVTNYSDPRSLSTSYVRNGFGDIIQRTSPDTGTTVYVYNALGKPTQVTDGRSVVTNMTYDNAGRLQTKTYPAATSENITYTSDSTASGNNGIGRLTRIDDASGSVEWFYNSLGQVIQEKKTTSSTVYTIGYNYDLDGNVTQMTYPSGRIVNFTRGSTGLITGVTTKKDSGSSTVTLASSLAYLPFGPLTSLTYGNGLVLAKTFTQDYLIDALQVQDTSTSTVVLDRSHAFGDSINLTGITDNITSARNESYIYTASNRLQEGVGSWGTLDWTYDSVGNRSSEVLTSGSATTSTYNYPGGSNLLSSITQSSTPVRSFSYDGAGNVTADTRASTVYNYRYNNRSRLDRLTIGSTQTADYTYDGLERLAVRVTQNMTPAGTTHYVYDLSGNLIAEATGTGTTVREYVWLDDMPLAVVADVDTMTPHLYFAHSDHLNRPLKMTDGTEAVVWDAVYKPFGEVQSVSGAAANNVRFPGQYFLIESGLHYNWYRHYDPTLGRYLQPDPLEFIRGSSIFAYAGSAPGMNIDFWGLADIPNPNGVVPGGPWDAAAGQREGAFFGPKQQSGGRQMCQWVPSQAEGGPPGSDGYWKTKWPEQKGWDRFNQSGSGISADEAHPGPGTNYSPVVSALRYTTAVSAFLGTVLYSGPAR